MNASNQSLKPKFSIIMPTYGRSRHIFPTIQSVLIQNFESFELLIIGDGVDDDTFEYCQNLDSRIRIHNLEINSGSQSFPNNFGCQVASGEYIAYLGHDDIWMPNHLSSLREIFTRTHCDVAVSGCVIYGQQTTNIEQVTGIFDNSQDAFVHFFPPSSFAHKKSIIDVSGGWRDPKELQDAVDIEFLLRLANQGYQFASTKIITVHKFHAGSRYLSYLFQSSDEQRVIIEKIEKKEISSQTCIDIIKRTISKASFMSLKYHDYSQFSPGYFYHYYRHQKGLEPIKLKKIGFLEYIPVDKNPFPLGQDWYAPEFNKENNTHFRWSGPSTRPKILLPFVGDQIALITLYLLDPHDIQVEMGMQLNFKSIKFSQIINRDGWHELTVAALLKENSASVLELILKDSFCPTEKKINADNRNLGIMFKGYKIQLLKEKLDHLLILEDQIALSNNERDQAISMLAEATKELEVINNERYQAIYKITAMATVLELMQNEYGEAVSRLSAVSAELELLNNEKKAYLNSTSWKITKPLRYIKNCLL